MKTASISRLGVSLLVVMAPAAARVSAQEAQQVEVQVEVVAAAASPSDSASDPLETIRAQSRSFVEAFDAGDAAQVASHWTENGDYIDVDGKTFTGRAAIETEYARFFAEHPGHKLILEIDSLKLLSDSAAIEDGRVSLEPAPLGAPGIGKYTAVHVKVDGQWLMSTVRDSRIATASTYERIADLEWLIGTWVAEEHGTKTESICRWVANKSFVERKFTSVGPGGVASSGVQLIGWNPETRTIESWSFLSDGGRAVGSWSPHEGGWSANLRGVTGEGAATTAVNHLTRLDDNAYVWRSTDRTLGGQALADSDEVVMKRQPQ